MKRQDILTHSEIMEGGSMCFRDLIETEVTNRNYVSMVNRAKAIAAIVTAMHREEIMESKRQSGQLALQRIEKQTLKGLKLKE